MDPKEAFRGSARLIEQAVREARLRKLRARRRRRGRVEIASAHHADELREADARDSGGQT